jgi:drug/metabolite transporter (DMT)-like permease
VTIRGRAPSYTVGTGLALAAATAAISGLSVFVNATATRTVPDAAVFTTLKNTVALLGLIGLAALTVRSADVSRVTRRDAARLTLIGLVGGGVAFLLFFTGLAMASAPSAAFIHKTMFVWVALMAGPFLGERLGPAPIVALIVLLVGQAVVLPPLGIAWGTGETLIALATLLWSAEVILARGVLGGVRSPIVGVARLGIGLIVLVGYLLATGKVAGIAALDGAAWAWVGISGVLLTGYVATWLAALRRAPATQVTSILVVGALVTAGLTALGRGALPGPLALGGYALVALGVAGIVAFTMTASRRAVVVDG